MNDGNGDADADGDGRGGATATPGSAARSALLLAVVLLVAAALPAALAATDPAYDVDIDGAVAVPTVEYTADGETVEVTQIGKATSQDTLRFSVDAPAGEYYTVRIVNAEQTVVETEAGRGDDDFSVPLRYYDVGTYIVAVTNESGDQRELLAAEPFVVTGYDVTQSVPDRVDPGTEFTVTATVEERGSSPAFTDVTVAVGDDSTRIMKNATRVNETTWRATFDADAFGTGEFTVVTGVRGEEAFNSSTRELLGVSDSATVRIAEATPTPTATPTATTTATATATTTATTGSETTSPTATTSTTADTTADGSADTTADTTTETTASEPTATRSASTPPPTTEPTATRPSANGTTTVAVTEGTATGAVTTRASTDATADAVVAETTEATVPLFGPLGYVLVLVTALLLLAAHGRTE